MYRTPNLARRTPKWVSLALAGAIAVPLAFASGQGSADAEPHRERAVRETADDQRSETYGREKAWKERSLQSSRNGGGWNWHELTRGESDQTGWLGGERSWDEWKRARAEAGERPAWKWDPPAGDSRPDGHGSGGGPSREDPPSDDSEQVDEPTDPESEGTPPATGEVHGTEVSAANTGPTAYEDDDLGRVLTYDDLTRRSGTVTTSRDGQVIEKLDLTGNIVVRHDDVVIRAVRIRNAGSAYSISAEGNPRNTTIEFVEVDGRNSTDNIGVYLSDFTLRHANVYGQRVGVNFRSNSTIENSYVHSQATESGSHNTAMSIHGGSNVVVRGNNLEGSTSAALSLYPRVAPIRDALIEDNVFNGGSYCTYAGYTSNHEHRDGNRDIRYVGNVFGNDRYPDCGQYGPVNAFNGSQPGNVWQDNTDASGNPVGPG